MALPQQSTDVVIASGAVVSSIFQVAGSVIMGIIAPTITSGALFLQAAHDTTSASFKRVQNPAGSGDWTWALAAGDKAVAVHDCLAPFRYVRLEAQTAQTAPRTFKVISKP